MTTTLGLSPRQKAMRATGLGASEVPIALGLSTFQTPAELAAVKRGELPAFEGNAFTHWGQRLERVIAEEWLDRHSSEGVSIFTPPTLRHPDSDILLASPDRIVVPQNRRAREVWQGLLEIKAVSAYRADEFDDGVPEAMLTQVQVQLEVTGLPRAWLVPLIGGNNYREFEIARDPEMGALLREYAENWWVDHVENGIPCPASGDKSYSSYLKRRYPSDTGLLLDPSPAYAELVARLREAKAKSAEAEKGEALASNALKTAIGDATGINGLCTWKSNKPSEKIDLDAAIEGFIVRLCENPLSGGFSLPRDKTAALWQEVRRDFTHTVPGARVLRLSKEK